ncbi:MAG: sigma-70 family RNA polymerase sigma factor [Opitutaceae bacterium]|nr:sigma-70 family RNA polymerase sigma factor [Opitutaceae bacterium]
MKTPDETPTTETQRAHASEVEKLFLAKSATIKGSIHALLRNHAMVEDVLQETFITVSAKAGSFKAGTNFVAWACTIARLKALEAIRKQARADLSLRPEVIEVLVAEAEDDRERESKLRVLETCIARLPGSSRRVIDLRYFQARDPGDIARLLSLTIESVYVTLSRARRALQVCVAGKMKESP